MDAPTTPTTTSGLVKVSVQGQQLHALQQEEVTYLFSREVSKVYRLDSISPSTLRRARDVSSSRETLRVPANVLCILKSKGIVRENATYTNMHSQHQVEELLTILRQRHHIPPWPPAPATATATASFSSFSSSPASTSCMDVLGEQNKEEERAEKRGEVQETSTPERNGGDSVSPESTGGDNVSPESNDVSPESNGDNDVSPESTGGNNVSPESNEDNVSPADLPPPPPPPPQKRRLLQFSGPVHGMVDFLSWLSRPKAQGGLELQHFTAEKTKEKLLGESHTHTHTQSFIYLLSKSNRGSNSTRPTSTAQ